MMTTLKTTPRLEVAKTEGCDVADNVINASTFASVLGIREKLVDEDGLGLAISLRDYDVTVHLIRKNLFGRQALWGHDRFERFTDNSPA